MKKVPIAAGLSGTFPGAGMLAPLKAMVTSRLFKLVAGCVLVYILMDVCFDMREFKEARFKAMFQTYSIADKISLPDAKQTMSTLAANQAIAITGVPADVLSDSTRTNISAKQLCPPIPPNLVGYIPTKMDVPSLDAVEDEFPDVMAGGHFRPKECTSRHRVAILIPYRNRREHLNIFIYNIHRVLARQQIDYGVFLIEQVS